MEGEQQSRLTLRPYKPVTLSRDRPTPIRFYSRFADASGMGVPRARPTMISSAASRVADQRALVQLVEQCAAIDDPSDGVIFEPTTIAVESIRDATDRYAYSARS